MLYANLPTEQPASVVTSCLEVSHMDRVADDELPMLDKETFLASERDGRRRFVLIMRIKQSFTI